MIVSEILRVRMAFVSKTKGNGRFHLLRYVLTKNKKEIDLILKLYLRFTKKKESFEF